MKKFGKFLFGTLSLAAIIGGTFYFFKNVVNKDKSDDFENFEDDFEDDFEEEYSEESAEVDNNASDSREYVTLNITPESDTNETTDNAEAPQEESKEE